MKILVVGIGLIGGSICKALKKYTDHEVYAQNRTHSRIDQAITDGAIDGEGFPETESYDIIWQCAYKDALEKWIRDYVPKLKPGTIVADVCGLKGKMTEEMTKFCLKYGIYYVGTHPMAGKEVSGYDVSEADLFKGCNFIITPTEGTDVAAMKTIEKLALEIGSGKTVYTDPNKHDEMIAYTSHMPHILANSLCNNDLCEEAADFAGGAFRDGTRVATMESSMWAELFIDNKKSVLQQIDKVIDNINKYRDLIDKEDTQALEKFIETGKKEKIKELKKIKNI